MLGCALLPAQSGAACALTLGALTLGALIGGCVPREQPTDQTSDSPEGAGEVATDAGSEPNLDGADASTLLTLDPESCSTDAGAPGVVVDVFPYPTQEPVCEAFDQPGAFHAGCPQELLLRCRPGACLGVVQAQGCCRSDGECGLLDPGYWIPGRSLGCIRRDAWVEHADWLGGGQVRVTCE